MGRSQPTVRNIIEKRRDELSGYRRMLLRQHQPDFDQLWDHAATDAPAIKAGGSPDVDWCILFAICRNQQREIEELREQVEGMSRETN